MGDAAGFAGRGFLWSLLHSPEKLSERRDGEEKPHPCMRVEEGQQKAGKWLRPCQRPLRVLKVQSQNSLRKPCPPSLRLRAAPSLAFGLRCDRARTAALQGGLPHTACPGHGHTTVSPGFHHVAQRVRDLDVNNLYRLC